MINRPFRSLRSTLPAPIAAAFLCLVCARIAPQQVAAEKPSQAKEFEDSLSADDILANMQRAYRRAESYVDNAKYYERFVRRSDGIEVDVPPHFISVAMNRPNRVRVNRNIPALDGPGLTATVSSSGNRSRAFLSDFKNQVLEFATPQPLTIQNLLVDTALEQAMLPVPIENLYPQLDLLLSPQDSTESTARICQLGKTKRLESKELNGHTCYRIRIAQGAEGNRVLWIDEESLLLRRMEMPTAQVRQAMDPEGALLSLELWVDFEDASFETTPDEEFFQMEVPAGATRVSRFIARPSESPDWLGKPLGEIEFTDTSGETVSSVDGKGKVVVLDFWFTGCAPCRDSFPALEKLYQKFRDNETFAMFAVSVDPESVPTEKLKKALEDWGTTIPILRDLSDVGEKKLGVTGWPTTLLIGPQGTIQEFSPGAKTSYEAWHEPIEKLLAGEKLAEQRKAEYKNKLKQFKEDLEVVTITD